MLTKKSIISLRCDECGLSKEVSEDQVGSLGWLKLSENIKVPFQKEGAGSKDYQFCSKECLENFIDSHLESLKVELMTSKTELQ